MELIENLLQLLVTFVSALLSGIACRKSGRQAYFLLLCFYGCFALGTLYWTLAGSTKRSRTRRVKTPAVR